MEEAKNKIESLLFATGRAMNIEEISGITNLPKEQVELSLRELQNDYGKRESSLFLFSDGDLWKLTVKDRYLHIMQKIVTETELDKSVTETLAVVAWKYPILQADVIKLRNNKAYDHLRQLEELGFIARERHGRTRSIKLTPKFFEYFDLPSDKKDAIDMPDSIKQTVELTEEEIKNTENLIEQKKMEKGKLAEKEEKEKDEARKASDELEELDRVDEFKEESKQVPEVKKEKPEKIPEEEVTNAFKNMFG